MKLLTIAIPTYNRADCLKLLLNSILKQLEKKEELISDLEILICDNNSTDETSFFLEEKIKSGSNIKYLKNSQNMGASSNVFKCFQETESRYIWIIGDDDLPLVGSIELVVELLTKEKPDIVYLPAKWKHGDLGVYSNTLVTNTKTSSCNSLDLIAFAGSQVTFISSWIINKETYNKLPSNNPEKYINTSFPHLEWILNLCIYGKKLIAVKKYWLIARGGSSSGYNVLDVFTKEYLDIVNQMYDPTSESRKILIDNMLYLTIPSFVWNLKKGTLGNFDELSQSNINNILRPFFKRRYAYHFFISKILGENIMISYFNRAIGKSLAILYIQTKYKYFSIKNYLN